MSSPGFFGLLLVAVCATAGTAGVEGSGPCVEEQLYRRVYACFFSHGLHLPVQPGRQDASRLLRETQTVDPDAQCQQPEVYKAATNCTLLTLRQCLELVDMQGAIPNVSSFHQGMDVICDRRHELDTECLKSRYPAIQQCGERTVRRLVHNSEGMEDIDHVICLSAEVHYDCARSYLESCGKQTMAIFLQQLDRYQVPSVCVDKSPGRPGRKRHNVISGSRALHSAASSLTLCFAAVVSLASLPLLH